MFFDTLKSIFDTFGAPVFVPVVIFIIARILGVKNRKAFMSALTAGIGLAGFNLIIGAYGPIVTPVITSMVNNANINLPVFDFGWQAAAIVAYSTEVGMVWLGVCLLLQTALFLLKWTNIFQPGDLWNNYSYMIWGSITFLVTGSWLYALAVMALQMLYTQVFGEMIQKRWSTYYKYPGCTIASLHTVSVAPFAIAMDWLLNKLGLYKIKADPSSLRDRLGLIGEPMTLGLILGIFIGILGNLGNLGTLAAWGQIAYLGIATAAVMAIFPKISGIFASSFTAITEASKKSVRGKGQEGWYLSVNDATGYGESATLITGILLIPITLIVAFILPGNEVMPLIDLLAIGYIIQPIIACSNGNMVKSIISGTVWMAFALLAGTYAAPTFTEIALSQGVVLGEGVALITSLATICQPVAFLIFLPFVTQNIALIVVDIIIFAVIKFYMVKRKNNLHEYLEKQAVLGKVNE